MFRSINIFLLTVLLSSASVNVYALDDDCSQIKAMTCGFVSGLCMTALSIASMVYPPVVTSRLLGDDPDGLANCVPAQTFDSETKDKMKMAQTAFIVNAAMTPLALVSLSLVFFNEGVSNHRIASASLFGVGVASLLAGLGAELAAAIQSQKAYSQIFGGETEYCSYPTTEGSKNDRKHEMRTILGFGYLDVIVKGLTVLGFPTALIYTLIKERCGSSLTPNVV